MLRRRRRRRRCGRLFGLHTSGGRRQRRLLRYCNNLASSSPLSLSGIKGRNRVISESLPPPSAMTEQEELYIAAVQDVGTEGMAHLPVMLSQTPSLFAKNLP